MKFFSHSLPSKEQATHGDRPGYLGTLTCVMKAALRAGLCNERRLQKCLLPGVRTDIELTGNHYGWKRPLRSSSPTITPTPPWLLNHVLKCHIYMIFEHLHGWGLHHFPGQPVMNAVCKCHPMAEGKRLVPRKFSSWKSLVLLSQFLCPSPPPLEVCLQHISQRLPTRACLPGNVPTEEAQGSHSCCILKAEGSQ